MQWIQELVYYSIQSKPLFWFRYNTETETQIDRSGSGFIFELIKTCIPPRSGKKWEKFEKKSFGFRKKKFSSETDTETEFWSHTII